MLLLGAGNPPGNLRVAEAVQHDVEDKGFTRDEVVHRGTEFVEFMHQHGSIVAGTSGVQGEAPKFLLTEADDGLLHVDGALADGRAFKHWLVKYPRGGRAMDRVVLHNEAAYHAVATQLGIMTHGRVELHGDTLFIPRFDRRGTTNGVERYGQESLASLAGVAEFGLRPQHQVLVEALARYASDPVDALAEYIARDAVG